MLPAITTTTTIAVLDSPQQKIQSLVAQARVQREPGHSAKQYIRSAQSVLNAAEMARTRGELEAAFVQYLRATTIVLEVVPQDKDFDKLKSDTEYLAIKNRIRELFSDTEKIKKMLLERYEKIQEIEASALETAAKASRPKPPPRPNKPDFLSASRHDGQVPIVTPIAALSPPMSLSSLGPAAPSAGHSPTVPQSTLPNFTPVSVEVFLGSQGSQATMSSTPLNSTTSSGPPPTSLASFRPLLPTPFSFSSVPAPALQPNTAPLATIPGISSSPRSLPLLPSSAPIYGVVSNGSITSTYSVPAPHPSVPPASAPAVIANGGGSGIRSGPGSSSSHTTSLQSAAPASISGEKDTYPYPLSIKSQKLLEFMTKPGGPSLLLIDARMQSQYSHARVNAPSIINIEPIALRNEVSAKVIAEQGMFNNPPEEQKLFADRASFELVIYYDQNSTEMSTSGALFNLFRALHDLEFGKPLFRRPVLLIGGFDAWLDCAGMNWVKGHGVESIVRMSKSPSILSDSTDVSLEYRSNSYNHPSQNPPIIAKLSRGGGVNRHDGRIIVQTIGDYIYRDDTPQSMVNPRIGSNASNIPNIAYPPSATPYTNINASFNNARIQSDGVYRAYSPGFQSAGYKNQQVYQDTSVGVSSQMGGRVYNNDTLSGTLRRPLTMYDNHWNNFGPHSQTTTPPSIPLSDSNISPNSVEVDTSSGPALSAVPSPSTMRPPIPPKPMRPLPQTPGMNDLRDYTKFGSGFSKIGSQLGKTGLTNL
ncbi:ubiquitin-specific protease doa4, partial [Modicella reniformis]